MNQTTESQSFPQLPEGKYYTIFGSTFGATYTCMEVHWHPTVETTETQRRAEAKANGYGSYDDFAFVYKGRRFTASFEQLAELMASFEVKQ